VLKVDIDLKNGREEIIAQGGDMELLRELLVLIGKLYTTFDQGGDGKLFKKAIRYHVKKRNGRLWHMPLNEGSTVVTYDADELNKQIEATFGGDQ
jgi:hypothetical protein